MSEKKPLLKRFLPQTLMGRSLMILITPAILIQCVLTFVFFEQHWRKITDRLVFAVAGEVAIIASKIEEDPSADAVALISQTALHQLDLVLDYRQGRNLLTTGTDSHSHLWEYLLARHLEEALTEQVNRPFFLSVDFAEKWVEIALQLDDGVLRIALPQRRLFSSTSYIFVLWMIGTSMVLMLVAVLFMRNQVRPIMRLAIAAERFGKGIDTHSFKPQGAKEVRQAGIAFLDMQDRIRRQIAQRTEMLANVSHDLRTPLTRMKLQLAMMPHGSDVEDMKRDVMDMETMLNGYLDFVRGDAPEQSVRTDLIVMLESVITEARRQGFEINYYNRDTVSRFMYLKPQAIQRCLGNLIGNAGKYASHIWISVKDKAEEGVIEIVIEDDGPGIPADQIDDVFKPFVRLDESRNSETGGVGLGLAIAQDIIHHHGGDISLSDSDRGGLKVCVKLPI